MEQDISMAAKSIRIPGPAHPITIERNPRRVQVRASGALIADTAAALTLREANYAPVQYIPRGDADMAQLKRSAHSTYCPYKGEAAYFDIPTLGEKGANAVWTYEQPYAAVAEIAGHLAFYASIASVTEAAEAAV